MTYLYANDAGELLERKRSLSGDGVPPATVEKEGVIYRRIFTVPAVIYRCMGFSTTDNLDPIEKWRKENLKGE